MGKEGRKVRLGKLGKDGEVRHGERRLGWR